MKFVNCSGRKIKVSIKSRTFEIDEDMETEENNINDLSDVSIEFIDPPVLTERRKIEKNITGRIRKTISRSDIVYLKSLYERIDDCPYYVYEDKKTNIMFASNTIYCYPVISKKPHDNQSEFFNEHITPDSNKFCYEDDRKKLKNKFLLCFLISFPLFAASMINVLYDWFDLGDSINLIFAFLLFVGVYTSSKGIAKIIAYRDKQQS